MKTLNRPTDNHDRPGPRAAPRRRWAGFTLVELMIVVAIIAVLAAVAMYAYGRVVKRARINEAVTFFAAVAGAQTAYYNHYGRYGATDSAAPFSDYDPPAADIRGKAAQWTSPRAEWAQIGVRLPMNTWFQYIVVAGTPDATCANPPPSPTPSGPALVPACASITNGTDWYYIVARGNQQGNSYFSVFGSSSTMGQDHWALPGVELQ